MLPVWWAHSQLHLVPGFEVLPLAVHRTAHTEAQLHWQCQLWVHSLDPWVPPAVYHRALQQLLPLAGLQLALQGMHHRGSAAVSHVWVLCPRPPGHLHPDQSLLKSETGHWGVTHMLQGPQLGPEQLGWFQCQQHLDLQVQRHTRHSVAAAVAAAVPRKLHTAAVVLAEMQSASMSNDIKMYHDSSDFSCILFMPPTSIIMLQRVRPCVQR